MQLCGQPAMCQARYLPHHLRPVISHVNPLTTPGPVSPRICPSLFFWGQAMPAETNRRDALVSRGTIDMLA